MSAGMVECGVCQGSGAEPGDPFRICGHCVGAGQLTASGRTSRTALQAMDYAAAELGGNGYDIVMEARAAVAELIEAHKALCRHFVNTLESGRDRIIALGGDCDPVDRMEQGDPVLARSRAALARVGGAS